MHRKRNAPKCADCMLSIQFPKSFWKHAEKTPKQECRTTLPTLVWIFKKIHFIFNQHPRQNAAIRQEIGIHSFSHVDGHNSKPPTTPPKHASVWTKFGATQLKGQRGRDRTHNLKTTALTRHKYIKLITNKKQKQKKKPASLALGHQKKSPFGILDTRILQAAWT